MLPDEDGTEGPQDQPAESNRDLLEENQAGLPGDCEPTAGREAPASEWDLAADFSREPEAATEHFFVGVDPSEEAVDSDVGTFDTEAPAAESITQFLQLPRFTPRATSRRRDPVVDFAKSVILTSVEYEEAAAGIIAAREDAAKEKERQKQQREETKKRKLEEKEEAMARRAAARQEAQRLRDLKAAERAEAQARRAAEREEAARVKAARAYELAIARAEKAAHRSSRVEDVEIARATRASESVELRQATEEGLPARGCWRGASASEGAAFLHQNQQTPSSQFSAFVPLPHAPVYHPPLNQQPPHAQYFFPSPSSGLPSLSQFDVSPHSTRPSTHILNQFEVPAITRSNLRNTSMHREGGPMEEGPLRSRYNVPAALRNSAGEPGDGAHGSRGLGERIREEPAATLRGRPVRDRGTARAPLEP